MWSFLDRRPQWRKELHAAMAYSSGTSLTLNKVIEKEKCGTALLQLSDLLFLHLLLFPRYRRYLVFQVEVEAADQHVKSNLALCLNHYLSYLSNIHRMWWNLFLSHKKRLPQPAPFHSSNLCERLNCVLSSGVLPSGRARPKLNQHHHETQQYRGIHAEPSFQSILICERGKKNKTVTKHHFCLSTFIHWFCANVRADLQC